MELTINSYCKIKENQYFRNGELEFSSDSKILANEFLTALYRNKQIGYPKYFKMDNLAKTGFLAIELLLQNTEMYGENSVYNTGLYIANSSSSLDTDEVYQETIGQEYFPSPSVFVYTLPNIVNGEIAIKHKFFGENIFFVSKSFDNQAFFDYIYQSFVETNMQNAIVGWVDYYKQKSEAFVMLVERNDDEQKIKFNKELVLKLYNL